MTDNEYCKHGSLICWNQCHECSDEEDEQGDKDKRIAELEAALAKCAWHSHIEELEEDAQKFHDDMEKYKADNARLLAHLKVARELIDEVASQCPEENDWLDVARRWLAVEIGGK